MSTPLRALWRTYPDEQLLVLRHGFEAERTEANDRIAGLGHRLVELREFVAERTHWIETINEMLDERRVNRP